MNSIWNKNLKEFKKRFPPLAKMYENIIQTICDANINNIDDFNAFFSFYTLSFAKNGQITGTQNSGDKKLQLHSSFNPTKEADNAFLNQTKKSQIIFLGCGLGYHVIKAATLINCQTPLYKKLIVIENNPLYFFASLFVLDWSEVFKIENLILAIGCPVDSLTALIETTSHINLGDEGLSDSHIFTLPSFTAHAKPYFDDVIKLIERNKTKNEINRATYNKFAKLWSRNSKLNLQNIEKCPKVNQLKTENFSKNFLIVAAGPSLQNILPYIKQLKEKMIIVCVETALHSLLKNDVEPDFIILTDPQYYAYRHIAGLKAKNSILIAPLSVHPAVFRFECKKLFLCTDQFFISQHFEKKTKPFGDLGAGGSVASSALNLCVLLQAKNIYIAGLDLSYPKNQTHIKGSSAEQNFLKQSQRLKTADHLSISSMFFLKADYGINYEEKKVLTDERMKMFAWWFESRIASLKQINIFSVCKTSLKIPGCNYVDIKQVLEKMENEVKKCDTDNLIKDYFDYKTLIHDFDITKYSDMTIFPK